MIQLQKIFHKYKIFWNVYSGEEGGDKVHSDHIAKGLNGSRMEGGGLYCKQ